MNALHHMDRLLVIHAPSLNLLPTLQTLSFGAEFLQTNVVIRHYTLLQGFISANRGYAWVRKGRRGVDALLRNLTMGV